MVVKLEERTLVVVGLADIAGLALVEDVWCEYCEGDNTNTALNTTTRRHQGKYCIVRYTGCHFRDGY